MIAEQCRGEWHLPGRILLQSDLFNSFMPRHLQHQTANTQFALNQMYQVPVKCTWQWYIGIVKLFRITEYPCEGIRYSRLSEHAQCHDWCCIIANTTKWITIITTTLAALPSSVATSYCDVRCQEHWVHCQSDFTVFILCRNAMEMHQTIICITHASESVIWSPTTAKLQSLYMGKFAGGNC